MSSPSPSPAAILSILDAVQPGFALVAGMQLDLFTPLHNQPMRAGELAIALDIDATKLSLLLYNLVNAGFLTLDRDRFANTDLTDSFLVRGKPAYMGSVGTFWADLWQAELKTAASIRSGKAEAAHDFTRMTREELEAFLAGQHMGAMRVGRTLVARYDFSAFRAVIDVGGGTGGASIGLVQECPNLSATVAELPVVVPITRQFVGDAGVSDRVTAIAVDVVQEVPPGQFDVAVLRNFIQVLAADDARRAVQNIAACLRPGGTIFIVGSILDDTRLAPPRQVTLNMVYLNVYESGQSYTEGEHRRWLTDAEFHDIQRGETTPEGQEVLTGRKR